MSVPLWRLSASALATAIRERQVTSRAVIEAHLDRIDAVNPRVNALTQVFTDQALRAADAADAEIAAGAEIGPLHGVPITIKENIDVAGSATTHGIVGLQDSMPEADAPIIAHLKGAGAIIIGRSNQPDWGMRWHTDNDLHGATVNPWDPGRTPGGSSGGEAVAIATGMSPLGIGNDMGGSVRQPAACCGIAALKPSLGRVSRIATRIFSDAPMFYSQVACVNGPMAGTVEDLRLALAVIGQPDPTDPYWTAAAETAPTGPVRVAVCTNPGGYGVCSVVADTVTRAADILADAGYAVEPADPPMFEEIDRTIDQIANMETHAYLADMVAMMKSEAGTIIENVVKDTTPDLNTYMAAIAERYRIIEAWQHFMQRYPLIVGPVSTAQAFEVGHDEIGPAPFKRLIQSLALTEACNLLGLPSLALPVQVTDGLPQGVQLIGARFHESLCFAAATAIENNQGVFTPIDPVPFDR